MSESSKNNEVRKVAQAIGKSAGPVAREISKNIAAATRPKSK